MPTASFTPRNCVAPPVAHLRPTSERPRRIKRNASVTMKDGSPVLRTICALIAPIRAANTSVRMIAITSGTCKTTSAAANIRPAKAIIDPMERSNSPPIMRSAAATARMPSCEAGAMKFMIPAAVNIAGLAVDRKKIVMSTSPDTAPNSGRLNIRCSGLAFFSRSSCCAAVIAGSFVAA